MFPFQRFFNQMLQFRLSGVKEVYTGRLHNRLPKCGSAFCFTQNKQKKKCKDLLKLAFYEHTSTKNINKCKATY